MPREIPASLFGPLPPDLVERIARQTAEANAADPEAAWLVLVNGRWEWGGDGPSLPYDLHQDN